MSRKPGLSRRRIVICAPLSSALGMVVLSTAHVCGAILPFEIITDPQDPHVGQFVRKSDGQPVFFNSFGYQPYEPGQQVGEPIDPNRFLTDIDRWQVYAGGSDPKAVRLYFQTQAQAPQAFYDGIRSLGFWVIQDIFFDEQSLDEIDARSKVDAILSDINSKGASDRILAWEIGNEFHSLPDAAQLQLFLNNMADYIRTRVTADLPSGTSTYVTWGAPHWFDPLYTDPSVLPVTPNSLDYSSVNAYSYEPQRIRDQQGGPGTGTPHAGYLVALKNHDSVKPLFISESGYANTTASATGHERLRPAWPSYRKGGMTSLQVAEALEDRFWGAKLSGAASGISIFEYNDEWWKASDPNQHDPDPEEHFGLMRFEDGGGPDHVLTPKFQEATIRHLYSLNQDEDFVQQVSSLDNADGTWTVTATLSADATGPVRLRWETSRGFVLGQTAIDADATKTATATFRFGERGINPATQPMPYLGPADVTAIATGAGGRADYDSITITPDNVPANSEAAIDVLTLATGAFDAGTRASGRVRNVDLDQYKVVLYIKTDKFYIQPRNDMKQVFIERDGYWWSFIDNQFDGDLYGWVVAQNYDPNNMEPANWAGPPGALASAILADANDTDNDLLPDDWEIARIGHLMQDRYDNPDDDWSYNLEEFLADTEPTVPDDLDNDSLWDAFEYAYFGTLLQSGIADPDGDGADNLAEMLRHTHPARSPVPEPASFAMLAVGCLVFSGRHRRALGQVP